MMTNLRLPKWLDNFIYDDLGAKYCRSNSDMTVIDWDREDVLNYLGTYFPRSYTESYWIFSEFFRLQPKRFADKEELSIFDFGCGTGGEIIGLLTVISQCLPKVKKVSVIAMDGNFHSLRLYERVLSEYKMTTRLEICNRVLPMTIDDFYDLKVLERVLSYKFDIFMTFKAICEFVTKDRFESENAYAHFIRVFMPKLSVCGIMLIVDVSTYNNVSQEWLPRMMDAGISEVNCNIVSRNDNYNQSFFVSHSQFNNDISKVAWRILDAPVCNKYNFND